MSLAMPPALRQKLAFLFSGGFGFLLYYAASLWLVRIPGIHDEVAAFLGVLVAIVPTFLLQKHFAFRHRGSVPASFAKYCLLQAFNALVIAALARLGRFLGLPAEVNFIVSAVFAVVASYLILSRIVFRKPQGAPR